MKICTQLHRHFARLLAKIPVCCFIHYDIIYHHSDKPNTFSMKMDKNSVLCCYSVLVGKGSSPKAIHEDKVKTYREDAPS